MDRWRKYERVGIREESLLSYRTKWCHLHRMDAVCKSVGRNLCCKVFIVWIKVLEGNGARMRRPDNCAIGLRFPRVIFIHHPMCCNLPSALYSIMSRRLIEAEILWQRPVSHLPLISQIVRVICSGVTAHCHGCQPKNTAYSEAINTVSATEQITIGSVCVGHKVTTTLLYRYARPLIAIMMVRGAISYDSSSQLVILQTTLTTEKHVDDIEWLITLLFTHNILETFYNKIMQCETTRCSPDVLLMEYTLSEQKIRDTL